MSQPPPATSVESFGHYDGLEKIGEGAFSEVMRAKDKNTGQVVALKRFKKRLTDIKEIDNLREVQSLKRVHRHPHIIRMEEVIFDTKRGILVLAFELMDCNLFEVLSKKGMPTLEERKCKLIMFQVMKALEYIHGKGIFHRDIKPENILCRGDVHRYVMPSTGPARDFPLIKLSDFGSCRGITSRMPYTEYIGTRWYRSPECLLFDGIYSLQTDVWGVGCILFEMLTKRPLFPGDDELDMLNKIHKIIGSPSPQLLQSMIEHGFASMIATNAKNPKKMPGNIYTSEFKFTPLKGIGIATAFPLSILHGKNPAGAAANATGPFNALLSRVQGAVIRQPPPSQGISSECLKMLEQILAYDPRQRISAADSLMHPWFSECRSSERALQREEQQSASAQPEPWMLKRLAYGQQPSDGSLADAMRAVNIEQPRAAAIRSSQRRSVGFTDNNAPGKS